MIVLSEVSKTFAGPLGTTLTILRDLNLKFETGAQVAVVGPSGSGKSTLLALLSGLDKPTNGTIQIDNTDITRLSETQLSVFRAQNVGIIFQSFHLLGHFSALQNVTIAAEIAGLPNPRAQALAALEKVGLKDRVSHLPSRLSGGEQQRVAIARALVARPKILLCDEPTGNLDPDNAEHVFSLIVNLSREINSTLILVSHDHSLSNRMDQRIELEKGCIKTARNPNLSSKDGGFPL